MRRRKRGYGVLLALTIVLALAAVATVIPQASASKVSLLGYKSHCAFAPVSTLLCVTAAAAVCVIRKRKFTEER
jgi:hypothetical protein